MFKDEDEAWDTIIDLSEGYIFHGEDYNEQRGIVVRDFKKYLMSFINK